MRLRAIDQYGGQLSEENQARLTYLQTKKANTLMRRFDRSAEEIRIFGKKELIVRSDRQEPIENVQAKLTIGKPNDKYEQEADRIAEQVMNAPQPVQRENLAEQDEEVRAKPKSDRITPLLQPQLENMAVDDEEEMMQAKRQIQRQTEMPLNEEEELMQPKSLVQAQLDDLPLDEEEEMMQAKGNGDRNYRSDTEDLENKLNNTKGGGSPLPETAKDFMESRFGADFSDVRVHNDSTAASMNQSIQVQAFTQGKDIYFNTGKYSPDSNEGRSLLAHELTHIVQQRGDEIAPKTELIQKKDETSTNEISSNGITWAEELVGYIIILLVAGGYYIYENSGAKDAKEAYDVIAQRKQQIKAIDPDKMIAFVGFLMNLSKEVLTSLYNGEINILSDKQKEQFLKLKQEIVNEVIELGDSIFVFPEEGERVVNHTGETRTYEPEVLGGFGKGEQIETIHHTGGNSKELKSLLDYGVLLGPTLEQRHASDYLVKSSNYDEAEIRENLTRIASGYKVYKCIEAAAAMRQYLESMGVPGDQVTVRTQVTEGPGAIIGDAITNQQISNNGIHVAIGIILGGERIVFDNIHPEGLTVNEWLGSLRTGSQPTIEVEEF